MTVLVGHRTAIRGVAFSPDDRRLVSVSPIDGSMRVWDVKSGQYVSILRVGKHRTAIYSPDGTWLLTAGGDSAPRLWQVGDWDTSVELKHPSTVLSAAFSHDGKRVATADLSNNVRVWDVTTGGLLSVAAAYGWRTDGMLPPSFSPDGGRITAAGFDDGIMPLWDEDEKRGRAEPIPGITGATAIVWDAEDGEVLAELKSAGRGLWSADFAPDGNHIVTGSDVGTPQIWRRRRPEWWWGHFYRAEVWAGIVIGILWVWCAKRLWGAYQRPSELGDSGDADRKDAAPRKATGDD